MVEIYHYLGAKIHFSNNLVSAYDILTAFSVPDPPNEFYEIQNDPLSSNLFRVPKRVRWESENGEMKEAIFLNLEQIIICLKYLQQHKFIKNDQYQTMNFLRWYGGIVDKGIEIWMTDRQEERIQDQLMLLAGYGKIQLQQEVTVLTLPGSQEKTRRYDIVEFNNSNIVKIRELKSHKITQQDLETTLKKGYLELAKERWPDQKIELIFSSLDGIDDQAELMIDTIPDVSYEDVQDFALRLYINVLENTPRDGWTFFKSNVVSKFSQILPDQKLLRAAEEKIIAKPEQPEQPEATVNRQPQPTQTYSIPQQSPQSLETENDRKDKPVVNPSLTQTPRYQIADVIPLEYETSILDWLERSGRLMDRTSETDESLLDSEEEIAELIENDGKYDDDDDDDILVDDD